MKNALLIPIPYVCRLLLLCFSELTCIVFCWLYMKVLCRLSSLSEASVTRRSAGLPLIINTILASEARIKQVPRVLVGKILVITLYQ